MGALYSASNLGLRFRFKGYGLGFRFYEGIYGVYIEILQGYSFIPY